MTNEIPALFRNGSNYDYHFIIKDLSNEFEGQIESLEENTLKYKPYCGSIEKENIKLNKDGNKNIMTIFYKVNCIDSARFMTSSLSNFVDNLAARVDKTKLKDCDFFNMKVSRIL